MVSGFVLTSFRGSTYKRRRQNTYPLACDRSERFKRSFVCTSSPFHSLRPCWPSCRLKQTYVAGFLGSTNMKYMTMTMVTQKRTCLCQKRTSPY